MLSALLSPLFSLLTNNNFLSKLLGKKTPLIHLQKPSIDQLDVHDRVMVCVPEEILVNILNRLPVRFLFRFKCVSKFCSTLISDPYFTMKHLNRDSIFSLYCCPLSPVQRVKDVQKRKFDCPSTLKPRHCMMHCCYNGLAIIEIRDTDRVKFLLWNPSIRESIVLPPLECPRDGGSRFGLGYDSSSGDYKILHIHQNRSIDEHPRANRRWFYAMDYLPFIHAAFHWLEVSINFFMVFWFDISNEVYREIPLSEEILSLRSGPNNVGVSALEGMLCVHSNPFFTGKATLKVWILKKYGVKKSWMPLLTIVIDTPYFNASLRYRFAYGEVLFWCANLETRGHAFRMVSRPFRSWPRWVTRGHTFWMVNRSFRSWPRCDTFQGGQAFTESLISPKLLSY
ncbi:hypothetical protein R3W88_028797 [Solanum pinnatisectum]|uniref:F-box domain-containing protein n=1 Tax=Solanum pinnatisectum TaxID=50273 RepID=A0AAV9K3Q3_9SOLN|nr:hypothetical protein R3W88_028797 [Solanum pinnatisectum]